MVLGWAQKNTHLLHGYQKIVRKSNNEAPPPSGWGNGISFRDVVHHHMDNHTALVPIEIKFDSNSVVVHPPRDIPLMETVLNLSRLNELTVYMKALNGLLEC